MKAKIRVNERNIMISVSFLLLVSMVISPTIGAIVGFLLAALVAILSPIALVPILMFAASYQLVVTVGPLQFGWLTVLGAFLGFVLSNILRARRVLLDFKFLCIAVIFLILGALSGLLFQQGRLDRLGTLLILLITLAMFSEAVLKKYAKSDLELINILLFAIALGAAIVSIYVFISIYQGGAHARRANELSIGFGVAESGSSNISRVLSFAVVAIVLSVVAVKDYKITSRVLYLVVALFSFVATIYTGSRMPVFASLFAILAAIIMSFVLHGKSYKSTTLIWSFVTIGLIVGIVYFISNVGAIRVPFLSDGEMSLRIARSVSVDGNIRLGMWASYFEGVSILRLLIGGGVGAAGNPHSVFVGAIMTFGLLGFIAVIMMMMQLVYTGGPKGLIVSVPMVAYLAISFASSSDVDRIQFWVLLGVSYVLVRAYKASESHQRISIPAGVMSPVRK